MWQKKTSKFSCSHSHNGLKFALRNVDKALAATNNVDSEFGFSHKIFTTCNSALLDYGLMFYTYNIFVYTTSSESEARELTENVDVAICKYISVHVAGIALYHHQVTRSTAVVLAH